jgi:hypothetical protein
MYGDERKSNNRALRAGIIFSFAVERACQSASPAPERGLPVVAG